MTDAFLSVPKEIGRANLADIKVKWEDGHESVYPAKYLRLACPCAGCVDEVTGKRRLTAKAVPEDVKPLKVEAVGRYAISIRWSDGHRTGIYAFDYLRKHCPCHECVLKGFVSFGRSAHQDLARRHDEYLR